MSFEAVHALALRRKSDLAALAQASGLEAATLESEFATALADGRVIQARGLYVLAPAGAAWLQAQYPQVFAASRADAQLAAEYDRFEHINRELKTLITQWQTQDLGGKPVPNDHSNADYDARILDRLATLHERAEALIARMATRVPSLGRYALRLTQALERAEAGESEWVSSVRCDSYHTVWFEMHEDLLRRLDRRREE